MNELTEHHFSSTILQGHPPSPMRQLNLWGLGEAVRQGIVKSLLAELCIKQKGYSQGRHFLPRTT